MGQAKRRGTFEERQAQAIANRKVPPAPAVRLVPVPEAPMTLSRRRPPPMMAAALAGALCALTIPKK